MSKLAALAPEKVFASPQDQKSKSECCWVSDMLFQRTIELPIKAHAVIGFGPGFFGPGLLLLSLPGKVTACYTTATCHLMLHCGIGACCSKPRGKNTMFGVVLSMAAIVYALTATEASYILSEC